MATSHWLGGHAPESRTFAGAILSGPGLSIAQQIAAADVLTQGPILLTQAGTLRQAAAEHYRWAAARTSEALQPGPRTAG